MKKLILILSIVLLFFTCINAQFNNALYLDGTGSYLEITNPSKLSSGKEYLVEFWFKLAGDNPGTIVSKWNPGSDEVFHQGWLFDVNLLTENQYPYLEDPLYGIESPGQVRFITAHNGNNYGFRAHNMGRPNTNEDGWHHFAYYFGFQLAYGYTGSCSNWLDGVRQSYGGGTAEYSLNTPGRPLIIGALPSDVGNQRPLKGYIDELRIWNRKRTTEQIKATMRDTLSSEYYTTQDSGLIFYMRFDEFEKLGVGDDDRTDDFRDFTSNGYNGDVNGKVYLVPSDIITEVAGNSSNQPDEFTLYQNYPNPFNPETKITFTIPEETTISLKIFDVLGNEVSKLIDREVRQGTHSVIWNGMDNNGYSAASGIYFYRLISSQSVQTKKMILLR